MKEVIQLQFLLQSVLHKIEDLDDKIIFKRELKQRSNAYYKHIEKIVEGVTSNMDEHESESHVEVVKNIDELINNINITE